METRIWSAIASDQLQRSCVIQPSVGATCRVVATRRRERLRWMNGQNENNARCVAVAAERWPCASINAFSVDEFVERVQERAGFFRSVQIQPMRHRLSAPAGRHLCRIRDGKEFKLRQ